MDTLRSDLPLLASLAALIEEASVSKAAQRLGVSQPAMSAQLARLRDLFGDPLLVPSGRKMVPTARALEVLGPLNQHLEGLKRLVRAKATFDPGAAKTTFRILAQDHFHAVVSVPLARKLAAVAPHVRLAMLPAAGDPKALWQALEKDEADFLVTSIRLTPQEAIAAKLFEERFVFAQRKGHPRGARKPSLDAFCAAEHVLISTSGGSFSGPTDQKLKALGRTRRVALSVPSFLLAPEVVRTSDFVSVLPRSVADLYKDDLDLFPSPIEPDGFPVLLSWHPKRQGDPAHDWLKSVATAA